MTPRLVPTADARAYLGGRHPATLGAKPIGNGRGQLWDIREIDARLDVMAGLQPDKPQGAANDELDELAQRIGHASRRA